MEEELSWNIFRRNESGKGVDADKRLDFIKHECEQRQLFHDFIMTDTRNSKPKPIVPSIAHSWVDVPTSTVA